MEQIEPQITQEQSKPTEAPQDTSPPPIGKRGKKGETKRKSVKN